MAKARAAIHYKCLITGSPAGGVDCSLGQLIVFSNSIEVSVCVFLFVLRFKKIFLIVCLCLCVSIHMSTSVHRGGRCWIYRLL